MTREPSRIYFPKYDFSSAPSAAAKAIQTPRVVIAHDYLTQRGGAERVVLAMMQSFPNARLVTSVYNAKATFPEFEDMNVIDTWLSRVPMLRRDPRLALPVLAPIWSRIHISDADIVICSSTGWSHGVSTSAPKLVYCHNPARWLYQANDYLADTGVPTRCAARVLGPPLRRWDIRSARSASGYLANSSVVARRVKSSYGIDAAVVHPPVSGIEGDTEPVDGLQPGFLLTVGRLRGYKNTDVVVDAVRSTPTERLVVVGDASARDVSGRIVGLTNVSDRQLRWLYRNAAALVACAFEDFGLTPVEAFSVGTPAILLKAGGYLDTMLPGVTGEFIESPDPAAVVTAITRFRKGSYSPGAIRAHARQFELSSFTSRLNAAVTQTLEATALARCAA